jgi:hypothetical protein
MVSHFYKKILDPNLTILPKTQEPNIKNNLIVLSLVVKKKIVAKGDCSN